MKSHGLTLTLCYIFGHVQQLERQQQEQYFPLAAAAVAVKPLLSIFQHLPDRRVHISQQIAADYEILRSQR